MKTVTLILPLEATTVNNPSNSSAVTVGAISAPDVTTAITPAVTPADTPLLSLGLISVVASRGRIWVTVFHR